MSLLATKETKQLATNDLDSKKDLIKRMFCKGSTDDELELFMHACKRTGLDPFMKQVYAVKRWSKDAGKEVMSIQTSIDGFRLIAERTGRYSPGREPTFAYNKDGVLISATAYVKKMTTDGTWHEVAAAAYYDEYVQRNKSGEPLQFWTKMPHVMLAKCAESLALRKAFPAEMSGIYTSEEMAQADSPEESKPAITSKYSPQQYEDIVDSLLTEINDEQYLKNLCDHLKVGTLFEVQPKDYEKTLRSLQRKIDAKEARNESSGVA